jgi:hypothetical protein
VQPYTAVVDKGTLDALHGDEHRMAMLRECDRCLSRDGGVIVSVSFAAVDRVRLLDEAAAELGLQWRMRVVGGGRPSASLWCPCPSCTKPHQKC